MKNQINVALKEDKREFLFILGSSRRNGNTELLANIAGQKLSPSTEKRWLRLLELPLPQFEDVRHDEAKAVHVPSENEQILLDATLSATDLVIASPLYWYSVSANTKIYLDYWTYWLRLPTVEFKKRMEGKVLWGICALSDEDLEEKSKPFAETLYLTAEYMKMQWGGVLLGYGNRPGDVLNDADSIKRAEKFFESVK